MNFNSYLGGGETLLIRMAEEKINKGITVITCADGYIEKYFSEQNKNSTKVVSCNSDINYLYLVKPKKDELLDWLNSQIDGNDSTIDMYTFCLRDLHLMVAYMEKYNKTNVRLVHLLLHPFDHLYLGKTALDKIKSYLKIASGFTASDNLAANYSILRMLAKLKTLVPMNKNVLDRVRADTGIELHDETIVPLPVLRDNSSQLEMVKWKAPNGTLRIVWLGRIVDFKIPAIKAMIDVVAKRSDITFDIIGYGNENIINRYAKRKNVGERVRILGAIPHDQLTNELRHYNIGYGMGTSLIELTYAGLPTIVALASPDFKDFIKGYCSGLVYEQNIGNVGDDLYVSFDNMQTRPLIEKCLSEIEKSPELVFSQSKQYISDNFSLSRNLNKYAEIMEKSKCVNFKNRIQPKIGFMRKVVFKGVSLL